jgi:hypothetical protein
MPAIAGVEWRFPHQAVHAGLGAQPPVRIGPVDLDRGALDACDFARTLFDHLGPEAARIGPAQVHAQEHGRPVLRLGAAGAGLDVEKRAARIHVAREHAREFQQPHALIESADVAGDVGESRFVPVVLDERQQFGGIGQPAAQLVEFGDRRIEPGALPAKGLCLVRRVPDRRIAELVIQLLEALALGVVLKGTP